MATEGGCAQSSADEWDVLVFDLPLRNANRQQKYKLAQMFTEIFGTRGQGARSAYEENGPNTKLKCIVRVETALTGL